MSVNKPNIYLRADGNSQMGLGHIYRCMAIAEIVRQSYFVVFIIKCLTDQVRQIVREYVDQLLEIEPTIDLNQECEFLASNFKLANSIIVLDGYHFDSHYQLALKNKKAKLISIDDIHNTYFHSDYVINHAGGINKNKYSLAGTSSLFLGPKYAIVRKQFLRFASKRSYPSNRDNLFICLGGADPKNDTIQILKNCEEKKYTKHIYLVVGAAYKYESQLNEFLKTSTLDITVLRQLDGQEMLHYMSICDEAISPPSTISFEYMMVGGILYLKQIADNQESIKNYFLRESFALEYDTTFPLDDEETHKNLTRKQCEVFDGKSGNRILELINQLSER